MKFRILRAVFVAFTLSAAVSSVAAGQAQDSSSRKTLSKAEQILKAARRQLGIPYVFGGTTPSSGFDCSGLIKYLLATVNVDVPRNAAAQANVGTRVSREISQLKVGDLLTFGYGSRVSHIGIYIGDGKFIHASTGRHRVVESLLLRPTGRGIKPWIGARRLAIADSR